MKKFSPKLIKSLETIPVSEYESLEKENQQLEIELIKTLKSLIELTIKFETVCSLTGFTDLKCLEVSEEEFINELNNISKYANP